MGQAQPECQSCKKKHFNKIYSPARRRFSSSCAHPAAVNAIAPLVVDHHTFLDLIPFLRFSSRISPATGLLAPSLDAAVVNLQHGGVGGPKAASLSCKST
jgi:hypothetical protein